MTDNNDRLEDVYRTYWKVHQRMIDDGYSVMEVAGVIMAQAMTLYKSNLTESEYNHVVDLISDSRDDIRTIDPKDDWF